jgi:amino acid adenylation domain-containing protein
LGVEPIGIHDNFFALGGDSIRSVRVRAQAHDAGISFPLEALFKYPTIHELVQHLDSGPHVTPESSQEPFVLLPAEERNLPENVEDAYPLTLLQAGMFFHHEYSPGDALYHNIMSLSVEAPFDADCWREALQTVAARHHVLRTSFVMDGNSEPVQLVHKHVEVPLTIDDIRNLSLSEKQDRIGSWFEREKTRSFDLRHAPVWRAHIHLSNDDAFVLSITEHHSILDGWSAASLVSELFSTYLALVKGDTKHYWPAARNIFRDYVAAERDLVESEECRRFWLDELHDMTFTSLPRWSWIKNEGAGESEDHDVLLPAELSARLKDLSQRLSVPVKSVLLAAHLRILSVLSNQEDIVTGVVTSNRPDSAGSYDALGLFLNTIPFRQRLAGGSWSDLIHQVFETEARVLPFQRYPLKQMQEVSNSQIAFETAFNFTHFHVFEGLFELPEMKVRGAKHFAKTNFPFLVNFGLDPTAGRIQMTLQYDNPQIAKDQVRQIGECFQRVLEAMVSEPERDYRSITPLSDGEWSNIQKWNQTGWEFPRESNIAEQFELQVTQRLDATALVYESERLSYRELNERANQLAHYLKEQGVGADVVVGVCQERKVDLIVSLLGIMKAGGAYLPMDPEFPLSRREYMIAQANAKLVLMELPEHLHERSRQNLERQSCGDNLAYVMYTSGSTGRPKGVCVTQANVLRLVHDPNYVRLDADSVILQVTASTFDVATFEIWGALLHGARLVLFPRRVASGDDLREVIRKEGVETLWLTSALYSGIVESGVEALAGVKQLLVGGEALPVKQVRDGVARLPETEFINGYGPTEVTTFTTTHRVRSTAAESWERGVPIGRPINNTECYVLNERRQLLPVGVVGELYVGGEGLARGYVGDAAQTAEKFVPNPYARRAGERLYRAGDLVRWRSDGELEFIGRVDDQVKLRGYRIEPGEIEQALREHEAVQDTIVVIREDQAEGKRLVAYVVAEAAVVSVNDLRVHLRERLPEYMVPSSFEYLERLPLNANGKVDREALPAPAAIHELAGEYLAPRTPTEEILTNIWSQVLGIKQVGINDNFFQLGGHSLTAMQIVNGLRKTFQIDLPLRDFFESPTVAELSQRVDNARRTSGNEIPLVPVSRDELLPLSFGQQRFWFLNQLQSDNSPYNLAVAVRLSGSLDIEALEKTFSEIVRRHEILRTTFHELEGHATQVVSPPQPVKLCIDDLSQLPEAQRDRVLKRRLNESANQRFDLTTGPLFKPELIALGPNDHVLSLTMHHIISDGWSIGVIVRELVPLYDAYVNHRGIELTEFRIQYADFAHWQRALVEGPEQTAQLDYWRRRLDGDLPVLNLPTDRPRPAALTYRGAMEEFAFSSESAELLRALSQRENVTLFMALLAVWQTLLHRYTGEKEVVNGTVIANRNRPELEGLIGFFVNTLVLRTDFSGNPTFIELLSRVRDVCLGAYGNQDLPFERLVEVLRPQRRANDIPLFQVMFALQNASESAVQLPGLTLSMMDLEIETSPFDITLSLVNLPQGGLGGVFRYSTDLFDAATIKRMIGHLQTLLTGIVANPEMRVSDFEIYTVGEKQQQAAEKASRKDRRLQRLRSVKLKSVELSTQSLVETEYFNGTKLPLVLKPKVDGVNLVTWAAANRDRIEKEILEHGSILFHNFGLDSLARFEQFASALTPNLLTYGERSSPRTALGGHVYTSTTHPADQCILLHNENSYTRQWPMRLWFFCVQPAQEGGRTPIADSRKVLRRIDEAVVNKFIEKKILYVRNYGDGLGLPWQEVFQTSSRAVVEEYCRHHGITVQWKSGDRLRTSQIRPAVRRHVKSGAPVWFNHAAFFHISSLDESTRNSTLDMLGEDTVPFNTFYGDGTPIEPSVLDHIREAYRQETVSFAWEKGDVLMLDNMLVSHGRESFTGPRQIVFIMSDQVENPDATEIRHQL